MPKPYQKKGANLRCPECDKMFAGGQGLAAHIRHLHPTAPLYKPGRAQSPQAKSATARAGAAAPGKGIPVQGKRKGRRCPQCGQTFKAPHYLAQHIQYRHPSQELATLRTDEAKRPNPTADSGILDHLQRALQDLQQRQHTVEEQLSQMGILQAEKEALTKQIDAVSGAIEAVRS